MLDTTNCQAYFDDVVKEVKAVSDEAWKDLEENLEYLSGYSNQEGGNYDRTKGRDTRCRLFKDRMQWSFEFVMDRRETPDGDWLPWFNGGLICHGDPPKVNWGVHT